MNLSFIPGLQPCSHLKDSSFITDCLYVKIAPLLALVIFHIAFVNLNFFEDHGFDKQ